jgi:uncharacterized membrane protein YhiD involved in acid resistance
MKRHRGGVYGGVSAIIFGAIWCFIAFNSRHGVWFGNFSLFPLIGIIMIISGIFTSITQSVKNKDNNNQEKPYYTDSQPQNNNQYNVYKNNNRCPMCGSVVENEQLYCINCGNKLKD